MQWPNGSDNRNQQYTLELKQVLKSNILNKNYHQTHSEKKKQTVKCVLENNRINCSTEIKYS